MKDISLLLKKSILGFLALFIFTACDYKNTTIEVGSLFDPTFDFSKTSELTFDENYVEIKNGKVQLKPLDLKHEGDDFNNGNHVGTFVKSDSELSMALNKNSNQADLRNILPEKENELLGYWRFEGSLIDSSINSNHLTSVGGAIANGTSIVSAFSADLDGVDDSFIVPNSFTVGPDQPVTISFWNYVADADVKSSSAFHFGELDSPNRFMVHAPWADKVLYWDYGIVPGAGRTSIDYIPYLDKWTHIVLVSEGASGNYRAIYLDGVLVAEQTASDSPIVSISGGKIGDGTLFGFPNLKHPGKLDEFAVWSSALSKNEIEKVFLHQNARFNELGPSWTPRWGNVVGYWKMNENWQDSSGNGNHGAIVDSPGFSASNKVGSTAGLFDGVNDGLSISTSPFFSESATKASFSGWFYIDPLTFDGANAYLLDTASGNAAVNNGFSLVLEDRGGGLPTNGLVFSLRTAGGAKSLQSLDNVIAQPAWYHFAGTYNGTNLNIFVNGEEVNGLETGVAGDFVPRNINFDIAKVNHASAGFFEGLIDDLSLFSEALDTSEVALIYNRQKQKYSGHHDSEIIDLGAVTSTWPDLSWSTSLPFGKELVGDFDNGGNPDSESPSDYSELSGDLSSELAGYWSFDESTLNSSPLGTDFEDLSGLDGHGVEVGAVEPNANGKFSLGIYLDGTDDYVDFSANSLAPTNSHATVSFWFKTDRLSPVQRLVQYGAKTGCSPSSLFTQLNADGSFTLFVGCGVTATSAAGIINIGEWYHLVMKTSSAGLTSLYVNGEQKIPPTDIRGGESIGTGSLALGVAFSGGTPSFFSEGIFDELAVWNREISEIEIRQLYRRGANRIKFQVKSCVDSSCECKSLSTSPVGSATDCDGDTILNALDFDDIYKAKFIGPGGDGTTYYSELFNRKGTDLTFNCGLNTSDSNSNVCVNDEITLGAGPRPTNPVIDYSDFPLEARPEANPYFQYRVHMEADSNMACDGSPCLPELTSVNLNPEGPDKFYGALQEVVANKPISYSSINSLTVIADDCATYQLSSNGSDYYYWSTSSWVLATALDHRSSKDDLETNIVGFATQFGPGLLYVKSFLETNANQTQNCSVQSIDLNYSRK